MNFRTELLVAPSPLPIEGNDSILTVGSCFSDSIGKKLADNKFKTLINPFGAIYNPISIHKLLEYAIKEAQPPDDSYIQNNEIYFNFNFHSQFSSLNKTQLQSDIQTTLAGVKSVLNKSQTLLITYGTAWIYIRKSNGAIVANCHKEPSSLFEKKLLNVDQITQSFQQLQKLLLTVNPGLRIILTLSPVRHLKDSIELNSVSKAVLRQAIHELCQSNHAEYFPAYEIMMDDLRDYRFYTTDKIHPTEEAIDYIWEKFGDCYFSNSTKETISRWSKVKRSLEHKPFHSTTLAHQKFLKQTLQELEELNRVLPLAEEIKQLKSQLL